MESKITLGTWEVIWLLVNAICTKVFINFPRPIIENSGTAAWIEIIYVSIITFILFIIIEKLFSNFQGKDILDVSELACGNIGRIVVGVLILFQLISICFIIIRGFSENMKIVALSNSPISFVMAFFLIGMVCGAYLGIEAIVRFHSIVAPIVGITFIFLVLAVSPYFDFTNFFPLLGNGTHKIFINGFFSLSVYAPLTYLFLMPPFIKTHKIFKKAGYIGLAISTANLLTSVVAYTAVFPYPTSTESFLPMYQLARLVNYGMFFQRIESLFILAWVIAGFMYISTIFFFIAHVFKKTFKLQYYRPLIPPFIIIIFALSFVPANLITVIQLENVHYAHFAWIVTFVQTFIILVIAKLRKGD